MPSGGSSLNSRAATEFQPGSNLFVTADKTLAGEPLEGDVPYFIFPFF